jgi:FKBP-type peptidyl-prolyl cis-trans isomerase
VFFRNQLVRLFGRPAPSHSSSSRRKRRAAKTSLRYESLESRALLTAVSGDFNHDGVADLAVADTTQSVNNVANAGIVKIIYGTVPSGTTKKGLTITNNQMFAITTPGLAGTPQANDKFGSSLAVGDFNGDGFADLAIGVPGLTVGGASGAGGVYIVFGGPKGLTGTGAQLWTENSAGIAGTATAGDHFGSALAAGDLNADHFVDLAIGVPNKTIGGNSNAGAVNVIYGSRTGLKSTNNQLWDQSQLSASTIGAGDLFGSALAIGDFNADGARDLAVGAPGQTVSSFANAGAVNVIYGTRMVLSAANNQFWTAASTDVAGDPNANAQFGFALAAGDFNDDSRSDLAIGAPGENAGSTTNAGAVHILMGHTGKITATDTSQLWNENNTGVTGSTAATGDRFGAALAAGRLNTDRLMDLAIGIPGANINSTAGAGNVQVLYGAPKSTAQQFAGLGPAKSQAWNQHILNGSGDDTDVNDAFGSSLTIGDFNGDHIGDLAVETPHDLIQGSTTDTANVVYGTSTGLVASGTGSVEDNQIWVASLNAIFPDTALAIKNFNDGMKFLAANKKKPGVITTADGLQYKIISNPNPNAAMPTTDNSVGVKYTGTLIDGTVFDDSANHPDPGTTDQTSFNVDGVVPGFSEMLKLMHTGEHVIAYIPANLAYESPGVQRPANIPVNSVLIFDMTLNTIGAHIN